eukprot:5412101-Amphidinium_carterae.1
MSATNRSTKRSRGRRRLLHTGHCQRPLKVCLAAVTRLQPPSRSIASADLKCNCAWNIEDPSFGFFGGRRYYD